MREVPTPAPHAGVSRTPRHRRYAPASHTGATPRILTGDNISESEVDEAMLLVLREANVRPEIIYAYQKTGRLVTEENAGFLGEHELAEWNGAVDEYRRRHGRDSK